LYFHDHEFNFLIVIWGLLLVLGFLPVNKRVANLQIQWVLISSNYVLLDGINHLTLHGQVPFNDLVVICTAI
jgi:hypothetical protein